MPCLSEQAKSVLDAIPVICSACGRTEAEHLGTPFPCGMAKAVKRDMEALSDKREKHLQIKQEIVGACPKCGAPIYGLRTKLSGQPAMVEPTCGCCENPRPDSTLQETMQTK